MMLCEMRAILAKSAIRAGGSKPLNTSDIVRELRGFDVTQTEFARRIHVAQSYLSALERGEKEPGATILLAISREFGKSVDWLLTGKG
jgi:transcriptional regulator with XRE-family HTH domain